MRILLALLSAFIGLALAFGGYRLARIIIPLSGFLAGMSMGGAVIADMNSTPFLGTVLGITVGLAMGLILGVFAYLYYYIAVVVLGASIGYWAGSSLVLLFGFNPGLLSALAGITIGALVGIVGMLSNAPKYVLVVLTAIAGAMATVGGILLLFNQIPLEAYSYTAVHVAVSNSFLWSLAAVTLGVVGILGQLATSRTYELDEWMVGAGGSHHTPPTAATPTGSH